MSSGLTLNVRKITCLCCFTGEEAVNTNWKLGNKEMYYIFIHIGVCVYTYIYNS
jgi:hypothetical protein